MENINKILEICQDISGRRKLKIVLHEIYPTEDLWNDNGITYLEQYVRDNADTVKGMPLCAEFLDDDKDVPYGHGLTGYRGDLPVFEDSVQVGTFEDWKIEDVEIDGAIHRCLCGIGYINENRYPNFCDWIDSELAKGNRIFGSIEFAGTKENGGEIIYRDGYKEKGRIPMIYDYTGYCIVSIRPADRAAVLLEFDKGKALENEFDGVFANHEANTVNDNEFDNIFLATIGVMNGDEKPESDNFDDVFGGCSTTNIDDMMDVFG